MVDKEPVNWKKVAKNAVIILVQSTVLAYLLAWIIKNLNQDILYTIIFPVKIDLPDFFSLLGWIIMGLGMMSAIMGNWQLLYHTRVSLRNREPFHIPEGLATTGIYRFTRNPIYLGVLLLVLGFFFIIASLTVLIFNFLVLFLFRYFIHWEEKKLEEKFGEEYMQYKAKVRRWV